jgi:hypothetical protein
LVIKQVSVLKFYTDITKHLTYYDSSCFMLYFWGDLMLTLMKSVAARVLWNKYVVVPWLQTAQASHVPTLDVCRIDSSVIIILHNRTSFSNDPL